jgi:hypothetical protein
MIGRHHTRHVSHRGWLTPHILRPLTYFVTAVTSPPFNRSAVLSARPPLIPYGTLCRAPLEPSPLLGVFNTLSTFLRIGGISSFWNLKLLIWGGQVGLHDVEEPFNRELGLDWLSISPCAFCIICSMRTLSPTLKVISHVSLPLKRSWLSFTGSCVSIISAGAGGRTSGNRVLRSASKALGSGVLTSGRPPRSFL